MKIATLAVALTFLIGDGCNLYNFNDNRTVSGGGVGPSDICAGLVRSLNVDSESGAQVKVGLNITFSADPRDGSGNSVPSDCKVGPVTATPFGECVAAGSLPATLDAIVMNAQAPGQCQVQVSFQGASGISNPVTIIP